MLHEWDIMETVAPLRITKNRTKPSLTRTSSNTSTGSVSDSSSPSLSPSSSTSSFDLSVASLPSPSLSLARQMHRKRYESWQIATRLVIRAEDLFETCLCAGDDVEEAAIRLRIAREEEQRCRQRVDRAALEIMAIKKRESGGEGGSPEYDDAASERRRMAKAASQAEIKHAESVQVIKRTPTKKMAVPAVPRLHLLQPAPLALQEDIPTPATPTMDCGCRGACLCSAVMSFFN